MQPTHPSLPAVDAYGCRARLHTVLCTIYLSPTPTSTPRAPIRLITTKHIEHSIIQQTRPSSLTLQPAPSSHLSAFARARSSLANKQTPTLAAAVHLPSPSHATGAPKRYGDRCPGTASDQHPTTVQVRKFATSNYTPSIFFFCVFLNPRPVGWSNVRQPLRKPCRRSLNSDIFFFLNVIAHRELSVPTNTGRAAYHT
jgi:hypothetical protein